MIRKFALLIGISSVLLSAQSVQNFRMIGLGDSIGEAVASADASVRTQGTSYLNRVANQMGVDFPLPYLNSYPFGFIETTTGRSRFFPSVRSANLAVSGADVGSALRERPDGLHDTESDLVLSPYVGSQVEIAEASNAEYLIYWLGNNDVLGAVLAFDHLDGSQVTPIPQFQADYDESLQRLTQTGKKVLVATIPSVGRIPFLLNNSELRDFAGSDFGLPDNYYTSEIAGVLLRLGVADGNLLKDPNWVLDPSEYAGLQQHLLNLNAVIRAEAAKFGLPVADVYQLFEDVAARPPVLAGVKLTTRINGGLFTLDSVHPSETAHAVIANLFIRVMNAAYGLRTPLLTDDQLNQIAAADPHIDHDGDGVVPGRPFAGFLETIAPSLGLAGDREEQLGVQPALNAAQFFSVIKSLPSTGLLAQSPFESAREALRQAFGLQRLKR